MFDRRQRNSVRQLSLNLKISNFFKKLKKKKYWSGLPCSSPGDLPDPDQKSDEDNIKQYRIFFQLAK